MRAEECERPVLLAELGRAAATRIVDLYKPKPINELITPQPDDEPATLEAAAALEKIRTSFPLDWEKQLAQHRSKLLKEVTAAHKSLKKPLAVVPQLPDDRARALANSGYVCQVWFRTRGA
jgi:hypothetical protein